MEISEADKAGFFDGAIVFLGALAGGFAFSAAGVATGYPSGPYTAAALIGGLIAGLRGWYSYVPKPAPAPTATA